MPALDVQTINPLEYPSWDDLVLSNQEYSFFHSSSWAKTIYESYDYKPLYFTIFSDSRLLGLAPVMEIQSILTGRRGVSLPFSDYCEPIIRDENHFQALFGRVLEYGKDLGWKYMELRGGRRFFNDLPPSSYYYGHTLDLMGDAEKIYSRFRGSTRRNIKKAIKEGVEVKICSSMDSVKAFYQLNCITRKLHGLPVQPFLFFEHLHDNVIAQNKGFVALATHQGKVVAAAMYIHFGEKAMYKYGASDRRYQHLRANNLVMWEAIKWYIQNGYKTFCFGKTEPENDGLRQFKNGWNTDERILPYYRYEFSKGSFVVDYPRKIKSSYRIFSHTPVPLLRIIGALMYKHVG